MSNNEELWFYLIIFVIIFVVYFLPSFIAYHRQHHFKHIILIINIFAATGIAWIIAFIWAIFPKEKSIVDPFVGNPTGIGHRNSGAVIGESISDAHETINTKKAIQKKLSSSKKIKEIEKLSNLLDQGKISKNEYEQLKKDLI